MYLETDVIIEGDSLTELKQKIPDKVIDLVICDPPYNINKAEWDRIPNYIEWLGKIILELQRVLKDNGSFYLFHNDMSTIAKIMNWIESNTKFVFKQMIVWNKKFKGAKNECYLQGYNEVEGLRNYQKMAEYILYYTFQDETELISIADDLNCFKDIKDYFRAEKKKSGLSNKQISIIFSDFINKKGCLDRSVTEHYFGSKEWRFPTKEIYENVLQKTGYFNKPYSELRQQYEELRQQYESMRYTFNNQKTHHSVWNYELISNKKNGHITEKPIQLIENIIKYSSNPNQIILDPFVGSGTTAIAAMNLGRKFIGIEKDSKYVKVANERINKNKQQTKLISY